MTVITSAKAVFASKLIRYVKLTIKIQDYALHAFQALHLILEAAQFLNQPFRTQTVKLGMGLFAFNVLLVLIFLRIEPA